MGVLTPDGRVMSSNEAKLKPALIGGVTLGVASAIPILNCLNCACCALVIGGGFLASYLYMKDTPQPPTPPYGDGAMLGAMTGAVGAVVSTILSIPLTMMAASMGFGQTDLEGLEEAFGDPEAAAQVERMMSFLQPGEITAISVASSFFFNLVLYAVFAIIGALIGVAVLHKKAPPGTAPPVYPGGGTGYGGTGTGGTGYGGPSTGGPSTGGTGTGTGGGYTPPPPPPPAS